MGTKVSVRCRQDVRYQHITHGRSHRYRRKGECKPITHGRSRRYRRKDESRLRSKREISAYYIREILHIWEQRWVYDVVKTWDIDILPTGDLTDIGEKVSVRCGQDVRYRQITRGRSYRKRRKGECIGCGQDMRYQHITWMMSTISKRIVGYATPPPPPPTWDIKILPARYAADIGGKVSVLWSGREIAYLSEIIVFCIIMAMSR